MHNNNNNKNVLPDTFLEKKKTPKIYLYYSLQCPAEINTSGSKTPRTLMSFHTNYD